MAQLRLNHVDFEKRDTVILVVGPENQIAFKEYWGKNNLPFIGIPDPVHRILKLYGQEIKLFKLGRMPAQVLVDKNSVVRFVHYGHSMSDIPSNTEILNLIDQIDRVS
jgi:peroxiredoxin